jgi:uncharacterized protein (DUF4415 family)
MKATDQKQSQNSMGQESDDFESLETLDKKIDRLKRLPRGAFQAAPGATSDPRKTKVRITLYLDVDVLEYFKNRAKQPNAAPYQTQINNELRTIMEEDNQQEPPSAIDYSSLLENRAFIRKVAEKVQEYTVNAEEEGHSASE